MMYFLYILQELQKKYNITLELEIIKLIYNYYRCFCKLDKYNLFELIHMLNKSDLTYIMNKKSIIDIFMNNKLYINHNFDNINIGINYVKCLYHKKLYSFIINDKNGKEIMQIHNDDTISFDNNTYIINMYSKMYQNYINKHSIVNFVKLKNLKTNIETNFTNLEFINLFINKDITYINSSLINWLNNGYRKN